MKITPLASDSMGTRSMATFVSTDDINILIDPGVSLAPLRYGLPPHSIELKRMDEEWKKIKKFSKKADVLIITHYHYDHHEPSETEIYENKVVLLKHPKENINLSQKDRAKFFLEQIKNLPKKTEFADGKGFVFGKTKIIFSQPVFHGTNNKLGYVIEVLIDDGYRFIHSSDVEGPSVVEQTEFIIKNKPNVVFLDGPLSYMTYRFGLRALENSFANMKHIIKETPISILIVDHHFLRDLRYRERLEEVVKEGLRKECKVITAAEFLGEKVDMLEAHRKELFKKYPEEIEKREMKGE